MDAKTNSGSTPAPTARAPDSTPGTVTMVMEILGVSRSLAIGAILTVCLLLVGTVYCFVKSAPPNTIIITSGPEGSMFQTNALKYVRILARHGVTVKVLPSQGSLENLQRLSDPSFAVDVGFVLGGITNDASPNLVSLGSISHQPLLIFYRGAPIVLLSELAGKQLVIGPTGSGTRSIALSLLQANGITTNGPTTLLDWEPGKSGKALLEGTVDAVFLMGEAASPAILRQLLRAPGIQLYSFTQAAAYTRRYSFLNVLQLPQGAIDLGSNLPPHDVSLVGPTVELVARDNLHPALSDLMLEAAREIHGRATMLQQKGEFPAPLEHDFRISEDAARFYKSGKKFFYRYLPFWLASLASRIVVVIVPMIVILIPIARSIPAFYRWRVRARIFRWYRSLLAVEKQLVSESNPDKRAQLINRLEEIENTVNKMRVPTFYADLFYGLRSHIDLVRQLGERYTVEKKADS